jgi:hypothetical protein
MTGCTLNFGISAVLERAIVFLANERSGLVCVAVLAGGFSNQSLSSSDPVRVGKSA